MFDDAVALYRAHRHSREEWTPAEGLLGRDRRIFQRVACQGRCRLESQLFGLESRGTLVNLSMGGLQLSAPVAWPEGSHVRIHLEDLYFAADGIVAYRSATQPPCQYGVRFRKLSISHLIRLRKILRRAYDGPLIAR